MPSLPYECSGTSTPLNLHGHQVVQMRALRTAAAHAPVVALPASAVQHLSTQACPGATYGECILHERSLSVYPGVRAGTQPSLVLAVRVAGLAVRALLPAPCGGAADAGGRGLDGAARRWGRGLHRPPRRPVRGQQRCGTGEWRCLCAAEYVVDMTEGLSRQSCWVSRMGFHEQVRSRLQ